jgi:hypothetical protein
LENRGDFVRGGVGVVIVMVEDGPTVQRATRRCCRGLKRIAACFQVEIFLSLVSSYLSVGPRALQGRIERRKVKLAEA